MTVENIPSIQVQYDLIAPGKGKFTLKKQREDDNDSGNDDDVSSDGDKLVELCRIGLECLSILSRVMIQCVAKHYLCEKVWTLTDDESIENRGYILNNYKHARYLYGDNENINENKNKKDIEELLNQFTDGGNSNINSKMNEILAQKPLCQLYCDKKNLDIMINKFDYWQVIA